MIRWNVSVKMFDILDLKYWIPQGMSWVLVLCENLGLVLLGYESQAGWCLVKCAYGLRDLVQKHGHTLVSFTKKNYIRTTKLIKALQIYVLPFLPVRLLNLCWLPVPVFHSPDSTHGANHVM
jgi:hypothetical protein